MSWLPPVTYWGDEWRDEWLDPDPPSWSGWAPDPVPARVLPPRCGRVMILDGRFERAGVPGDPGDPPLCGRPAGHNGRCRSEAAVARYYAADRARQAAGGRRSRAA